MHIELPKQAAVSMIKDKEILPVLLLGTPLYFSNIFLWVHGRHGPTIPRVGAAGLNTEAASSVQHPADFTRAEVTLSAEDHLYLTTQH